MKNYLFSHNFKKLGLIILIPSLILGIISMVIDIELDLLFVNMPTLFKNSSLFGDNATLFGFSKNNMLDEIIAVFIIMGGILTAFSKEKIEDEYISKIRLESLVWATYINYLVLIISIIFIYDISFIWVMIFNMFTILIFFIVRFNWKLKKLKVSGQYE